jgi:hypothetical protein
MTPSEVVKSIQRLNGRTITVAGYLGNCAGYDCALYTDATQAKLAADWFKRLHVAMRNHDRRNLPEEPADSWHKYSLGIGSGDWQCHQRRTDDDCLSAFDRKAAPFQNSYVLITGRATKMCRDEHGEPGCIDRSTDLFPTEIKKWNRTANG